MKPATVKEIIETLQKLPQDLPCYFRPKYYGTVRYYEDVPVRITGIGRMEGAEMTEFSENVTFLL